MSSFKFNIYFYRFNSQLSLFVLFVWPENYRAYQGQIVIIFFNFYQGQIVDLIFLKKHAK